jgi:hypothetical protein
MPTTESATQSAMDLIMQVSGKAPPTKASADTMTLGGGVTSNIPLTSGEKQLTEALEFIGELALPSAMRNYGKKMQEQSIGVSSELSNLISRGIAEQNPRMIERFKKQIVDQFGQEGYDSAFAAAQNPKAANALSTVQAEDAYQAELARRPRRPWEFDDPVGEFWLPTLLGADPGNLILSNMEYNRELKKVQAKQVQDRKWFQLYQNMKDNGVPHSEAFNQSAAQFGYVPSGAASLSGLSSDERDVLFHKGLTEMMNNPVMLKTVQNVLGADASTQDVARGVAHLSLRALVEQNGYIPEALKGFYNRQIGLDDPERRVKEAADQAFATAIAEEAAESQTWEGMSAEERFTRKQQIEAGIDLQKELESPVSSQTAESLGVPVGTTLKELTEGDKTSLPATQVKTLNSIDNGLNIVEKLKGLSEKIHTSNKWDFWLTQGWTKFKSITQQDVDAKAYDNFRSGLRSWIARNIGSDVGNLTEQEQKYALNLIPPIIARKDVADRMFQELTSLMNKKREQALRPPTQQAYKPTSNAAEYRWNPKTQKVEKIK